MFFFVLDLNPKTNNTRHMTNSKRQHHQIFSEFADRKLSREDLAAEPFNPFGKWLDEAVNANAERANAMTLATATPEGRPSARTVLLKGFSEQGFDFFGNVESRKGRELAANPRAALLFFWPELGRQVRIEGGVSRLSAEESRLYFQSRPRESQLAAWASEQSAAITDRQTLDKNYAEAEKKYAGQEIPLPPAWGGWRLIPDYVEFWQGRPNRLHDRFEYRLTSNGEWRISRLAP